MLRKIYLTIDDAPSINMAKKIDFLIEQSIPAIFYARGEHIAKYPDQIVNAIENGFLIGNHSYSHPCASDITFTEFVDEIMRTEKLIDECYLSAGKERPCKIIRLPFGDRGAGVDVREPETELEKNKVNDIQSFLRENNFKQLNFQTKDLYIDSGWDWDAMDYKASHINNPELYMKNIREFFGYYKNSDTAVILLHDFDHNHHLFEATMEFLLAQKLQFLDFHAIS